MKSYFYAMGFKLNLVNSFMSRKNEINSYVALMIKYINVHGFAIKGTMVAYMNLDLQEHSLKDSTM